MPAKTAVAGEATKTASQDPFTVELTKTLDVQKKFDKKIIDTKVKVTKLPPGLKTPLQEKLTFVEKRNSFYNQKLKSAKTEIEIQNLLHSQGHERLDEVAESVSDMANFLQTKKNTLTRVTTIEKYIATQEKKKIILPFQSLKEAMTKLKTKLPVIEEKYKRGKLTQVQAGIDILRKETVPLLKKFERDTSLKVKELERNPTKNKEAITVAKKLLDESKKLRWMIVFEYPRKVRSGDISEGSEELLSELPGGGDPEPAPYIPTGTVPTSARRVYNVFFCAMNFPDNPVELTPELLAPFFDRINAYFQEVSYGQIWFNFQYQIINEHWAGPTPVTEEDAMIAAADACDPYVDYTTKDVFMAYPMLSIRPTSFPANTPFLFITDEGEISFPLGAISLSGSASQIIENRIDPNIKFFHWSRVGATTHEMGHLFFIKHAEGYECGSSAYLRGKGQYGMNSDCIKIEYGNPYDTMGSSLLTNNVASGHYSGAYKERLDLISTLYSRDDGTYPLGALEVDLEGNQLLEFPYIYRGIVDPSTSFEYVDSDSTQNVWIEYRKPIGFDNFVRYYQDYYWMRYSLEISAESVVRLLTLYTPPESGCLNIGISRKYYGTIPESPSPFVWTKLIDVTPGSLDEENDFIDACLPANTVFSSDELGMSISFVPDPDHENTALVTVDFTEELENILDAELRP